MIILKAIFVIVLLSREGCALDGDRAVQIDPANVDRVESDEGLVARQEGAPLEPRNADFGRKKPTLRGNDAAFVKNPPQNAGDIPLKLNKVPEAGDRVRQQPQRAKVRARPQLPMGLATSEECGEDVQRICGHKNLQSNLEVLSCLTNSLQSDDDLRDDCHSHLWEYKLNITKDPKFESVARDICKPMLKKFPGCGELEELSGKLIPCLLEHKNEIDLRPCYHFLVKMGTIIYSDYRLICNFVDECQYDIKKYDCGRIDTKAIKNPDDTKSHSQGAVISCLEEVIVKGENVEEKCAKQIVRLSELSSDDFHLDRNLFFACQDDRERLCEEITSGEGRVYKCLFRHKFDHQMSMECRDALTLRQKMLARDYRASYELHKYCKNDIDILQCTKHPEYQLGGVNDHDDIIGLSGMLLCLESAKHAENSHEISQKCDEQLADFRRMLSEDYQMSPEIVKNCAKEIHTSCSEDGMKKNGETIHCLMALAQDDGTNNVEDFSEECEMAIMHLLKEEEVVSDYRMDYALAEACNPVVGTVCKHHGDGDPMVLSCLMEHLHSDAMVDECRKRLLELQYFISRDFFLNEMFFKKCHKDAQELCDFDNLKGADKNEVNMPFSLVVSCLYRHIRGAPGSPEVRGETSRACAEEVRTAMKDRALEFHLNPALEKACIHSLGLYCSHSIIEKGYELVCLQDHFENITKASLEGDKQATDCIEQLEEITEIEEAEAGHLDNILLRACEPDVDRFCAEERDDEEEGEVMKCLVENKYQLTRDCESGVTHFQLIELKDIKFSYNFMKACKEDIKKQCPKGTTISTKNEIIQCLSGKYLKSVLEKQPSPIREVCRDQLTVENLQRHEEINLNPELKKNCQADYRRFCKQKLGKAKGIECLRLHHDKITPKCRKQLFKLEQEEVIDPRLDVTLLRSCKASILDLCPPASDPESVLECLIHNKGKLTPTCREVVREREREQFADINLNPELKEACQGDIEKHCANVLKNSEKQEMDGERNGEVISCLKEIELNGNSNEGLSPGCSRHIRFIAKEEENDYKLDPVLTLHCLESIERYCKPEVVSNVVECLKQNYFQNNLVKDTKCMFEVARMLREGRYDIMADPVLHNACQLDIHHYCADVAEGKGRIMMCLLDVMDHGNQPVTQQCSGAISQRRQMWEFAREHNMESFGGIVMAVWNSPQSSFLMTGLTLFLVSVLIIGICCGRVTKRVSRQRKML